MPGSCRRQLLTHQTPSRHRDGRNGGSAVLVRRLNHDQLGNDRIEVPPRRPLSPNRWRSNTACRRCSRCGGPACRARSRLQARAARPGLAASASTENTASRSSSHRAARLAIAVAVLVDALDEHAGHRHPQQAVLGVVAERVVIELRLARGEPLKRVLGDPPRLQQVGDIEQRHLRRAAVARPAYCGRP